MAGKIYFAGIGPGDASLLPARLVELLGQCDLLIHGPEWIPRLNRLVFPAAERRAVAAPGKIKEEALESLLKQLENGVQEGLSIVRTCLGDPWVLLPEIEYCRLNNLNFELIPFIPFEFLIPSLAGIPIARPQVSGSIHVINAPYPVPEFIIPKPEAALPPLPPLPPPQAPPPQQPLAAEVAGKQSSNLTTIVSGSAIRKAGFVVKKRVKDPIKDPSAEDIVSRLAVASSGSRQDEHSDSLPAIPPVEPPAPLVNMPKDPVLTGFWRGIGAGNRTVILMEPREYLDPIRQGLVASGFSDSDMVAFLWTTDQGTLARIDMPIHSIVGAVMSLPKDRPSMLLIGAALRHSGSGTPLPQKALLGKRIALIDEDADFDDPLEGMLDLAGAMPTRWGLLQNEYLAGLPDLLESMHDDLTLAAYMVFEDVVSAEALVEALQEADLDVRKIPSSCQIMATNAETALRLRRFGLKVRLIEGTSEELNPLLANLPTVLAGRRLIMVGPVRSRPGVNSEIQSRGGLPTELCVYESTGRKDVLNNLETLLASNELDAIVIRNEPIVKVLFEAWGGERLKELLANKVVACRNFPTAQALANRGVKAAIQQSNNRLLCDSLEASFTHAQHSLQKHG